MNDSRTQSDAGINRWEDLFEDIKAYLNQPPRSEQVQQAAQRWQLFLDRHTEGSSLEQEYNRLYQSVDQDLIKKQQFYNELQAMQNFVSEALKVSP